jgi:hypothetical protein
MPYNTLKEAMSNLPKTPKDLAGRGVLEAREASAYTVVPLYGRGKTGEVDSKAATLWLHHRVSWSWDFFSYSSDCWAWVTDAQDGGNPVAVDRIEAFLRHDGGYPSESDAQTNSASAHAFFRNAGVAVSKQNACGHGCAEKAGYGKWCTPETCAT